MKELNESDRSMAEVQVAWHEYYSGLTNKEKHEVWQEFYDEHANAKKAEQEKADEHKMALAFCFSFSSSAFISSCLASSILCSFGFFLLIPFLALACSS